MVAKGKDWVSRRWRGALMVALGVLLCFVGMRYTLTQGELEAVRAENAGLVETLVTQTSVILDLRQKLQPRDFESMEELAAWAYKWNRESMPVFIEFLGLTVALGGDDDLAARYADCDDASEAMQRDALWDGYRVSEALVAADGTVYGVLVSQYGNHAGCMAVAGGVYYYIEPQTGGVVLIFGRD